MVKIFNIPANYNFFENLLEFIKQEFQQNNNFEIKNIKLFLPNRRSCREFKKIFNQNCPNSILPQIKAISDISYEDFNNQNTNLDYIENLAKFKNISKLQYLLFLTNEISNLEIFQTKNNFLESFKIANNLAQLFEDIEIQGINFDKLKDIDDSNLAQNKKLTLQTLQLLHVKVKKSLLNNNIYNGTLKQNIIINSYIDSLNQSPNNQPIIIAGSTGSVLSGKKLINCLAKNNYIILNGLTRTNDNNETHPQYFLNELINYLNLKHSNIKDIKLTKESSSTARQDFLKFLMCNHQNYINEDLFNKTLNNDLIKQDLKQNFNYIECVNEIKEAKIITQICQENTKTNKEIAIITNNNSLIKYLRFELEANDLEFNDTTNKSIFESQLIQFILLILQLNEKSANSHQLLALLKHQYFNKENIEQIILDLELKILRNNKKNNDLETIIIHAAKFDEIAIFLKNLKTKLQKLNNNNTISDLANNIIKICQDLSKQDFNHLINQEPCANEIYEFFDDLKNSKLSIKNNFYEIFKNLLNQISFFYKSNAESKIQILSTIEARLLNFDLAIIASLNEGDFPEYEKAGWLGKKIKKDLGIDRQNKKIGQSAYDFCNYLSNKEVFITRHLKQNNQELIASPFLLKLQNLLNKLNINIDKSQIYNDKITAKNIKKLPIKNSKIKPAKSDLFNEISITDITKLIKNPYQIYLKKILKLKPLKKIDYEPSHAEFGSFVHEILEKYISQNLNNINEIAKIFEEYFKKDQEKLIWWPKFLNIFNNFKEINKIYQNSNNFVEKEVNFTVKNLKIHGKIDRVISNNSALEILDYKTGQTPSKKDIISGLQSQLVMAALGLINDKKDFADYKINKLSYFKLSSFSKSEIKNMFDDEVSIQKLLLAAQDGTAEIVGFFIDGNCEFVASVDIDVSEYFGLVRLV